MRRLHHDVPPARVHVRDLRARGLQPEVPPPAVPYARVPEALRDRAGGRRDGGGKQRDDERPPGLAEEDGGDEAGEEEDRDEGGAALVWRRRKGRWRERERERDREREGEGEGEREREEEKKVSDKWQGFRGSRLRRCPISRPPARSGEKKLDAGCAGLFLLPIQTPI